jgi:hypothetical protein
MNRKLSYICDICYFESEDPQMFYGMYYTVHNPPLNRTIVLPEASAAISHICTGCAHVIKNIKSDRWMEAMVKMKGKEND